MKRSSLLTLIELAALLAAVAVSLLLASVRVGTYDLLWFVLGLSVLKLSDVWLPRGDAVGMSSALALGGILLFDARFVLVVLAVAEVAALIPKGRERKWRGALGALAAEAVATVACSSILVLIGLRSQAGVLTRLDGALLPVQYLHLVVVAVLFAVLEHLLLQAEAAFRDRRPMGASILGSLSYGGWLIAAQASAGVLATLMYRTMGAWGLLVSVVMILVMRQSFVLLLDIRQAYDATIGVLVRAMEAQSPGREGIASRNADLSVSVGRSLGMHGAELERVRYAALLLGLGEEESQSFGPSADTSHIVEDVEFLKDITPVLRLCNSPRQALDVTRSDLVCSYLVLSIAAATHTGSVERLEELKERVSPRIVREVDAAVLAEISRQEPSGPMPLEAG